MQIRWQHKYERSPGKWVFVPTEESKNEGIRIKDVIEQRWHPPEYYFHLRSGGHVAALRSHAASPIFLRLDIQDFFGSVTRSRVTRCLKSMFDYTEARRIATASTVKHPTQDNKVILPYGFVQSPILASLALAQSALGSCLERLSKQRRIHVSVYMDDIIVSSNSEKYLTNAQSQLEEAAKKARFAFHSDKTEGPANMVTAFNIELSPNDLSVAPHRLQQFAETYRSSDSGLQKEGIAGYVNSVNPNQVAELL